MLEHETKKMEEKLELVKKMMELEKQKRINSAVNDGGTIWRGATTNKSIKDYSNEVLKDYEKKRGPNLPPMPKDQPPKQQTQQSKKFVGSLKPSGSKGKLED
mmetsp:Transcript_1345/g.1748  ORF Transcript_1345/g.1748 Transcript_1345/m.1748 type:complete len:102 (-) Transcript_1345:1102-1407(-)